MPGTPLPNATLTGNPVRSSIVAVARDPAHDPACVAVYGGAQGARTINRAALGCYDRWRARHDLAVHHVCGPRNLDECRATLEARRHADDKLQYDLVAYEEHMDKLLALCAEPKRAVDVFPALFRSRITSGNYGMATGESIAHLNCLMARGLVRWVDDVMGPFKAENGRYGLTDRGQAIAAELAK